MLWVLVVVAHGIMSGIRDSSCATFKWSTEAYKQQAAKSTCTPLLSYPSTSLKNRNHAANITQLGKVRDIEVCGILCCEMESCDLALLDHEYCYAIKCSDLSSCALESKQDKCAVLTFKRRSGSDIWSTGDIFNPNNQSSLSNPGTASNTDHHTKDAESENQKKNLTSPIEKSGVKSVAEVTKTKEQIDVRAPVAGEITSKKEHINVGDKVQDLTEHYMKASAEKGDITALQENETSAAHHKVHHAKDLRHTLISPITIGAFTCMAVLAVSGFAMAIIKYQQDTKDYEEKQKQQQQKQ